MGTQPIPPEVTPNPVTGEVPSLVTIPQVILAATGATSVPDDTSVPGVASGTAGTTGG